jgi:hypothetical protein
VKTSPLWEISVITATEAEEAVVELLERVFKSAAVVYKNEITGRMKISVYCQGRARTPLRAVSSAFVGASNFDSTVEAESPHSPPRGERMRRNGFRALTP